MSWQDIPKQNEDVQEIRRLVAEVECEFNGPPDNRVRVKVYESASGHFSGYSDYTVQAPGAASPYRSIAAQGSIDEAVADALRGLSIFGESPDAKWFKDETF